MELPAEDIRLKAEKTEWMLGQHSLGTDKWRLLVLRFNIDELMKTDRWY